MPRKSSPSMPERKITTMPLIIDHRKNLPAVFPEKPSFLQTMKEGFALGVGSSLGRKAVDGIFGTTPIATPMAAPIPSAMAAPIAKDEPSTEKEFDKCMKRYDDRVLCKELYSLN